MGIPLTGLLCWFCILGVIYSYLGYPLVLMLLALFKSRLEYSIDDTFQPNVTLLIAAYNEESVIQQKIRNCLELNYPKNKFQILIAVDGSEDRTLDFIKLYSEQGVEYSHTPQRQGKMAAINQAMKRARGDIIVFSDANNLYEKNTIKHLIAPFVHERWGAVSGAKHITETDDALSASEGLYWKYESVIKALETRVMTCTAVAGEILAIRRTLYTPPPKKIINDDFFLAMNILARGYHIFYEQKARSFEPASQFDRDEMTRRSRINAGRYQAMAMAKDYLSFKRPVISWQIISHKFSRPLVPIAMILLLMLNLSCLIWPFQTDNMFLAFFGLAYPYNWTLLIIQVCFYCAALTGRFIRKPKSLPEKIFYLTTFLLNSNIAALSGFFNYLRGNETVLWKKVSR